MKNIFRKIFSPILSYFEGGEEEYSYKQSHRIILIIVGLLFTILSVAAITVGFMFSLIGAVVPGVIFVAIAITCLVVAFLGNDRAVAKIWGNK